MKRLFFDTETSGLPKNWKAKVTELDNWPRLVQLAYIITEDTDDGYNIHKEFDYIVKPVGFTIPDNVAKVHGITQEIAMEKGIMLDIVLNQFVYDVSISDVLIAHNMNFDEKIMGAECIRDSGTDWLSKRPKICTMKSSTSFCAIPGPYGSKWPKLDELYQKLFGVSFEEEFGTAHNALNDIRATIKCFYKLKQIGVIKS